MVFDAGSMCGTKLNGQARHGLQLAACGLELTKGRYSGLTFCRWSLTVLKMEPRSSDHLWPISVIKRHLFITLKMPQAILKMFLVP